MEKISNGAAGPKRVQEIISKNADFSLFLAHCVEWRRRHSAQQILEDMLFERNIKKGVNDALFSVDKYDSPATHLHIGYQSTKGQNFRI